MPFWDKFKRWQLTRKGLSSGKKRKRHDDENIVTNLDDNIGLRSSVFVLFMILMLGLTFIMSYFGFYTQSTYIKLVKVLFTVLAIITVFALNHKSKLPKARLLLLSFGGLFLQVALGGLALYILQTSQSESSMVLLVTPFALVPMIHSLLLGRWLGIFTSVFSAVLYSFLLPSEFSEKTFIIAMLTSLTAVYFTRGLVKRRQILSAGFFSGIMMLIAVWVLEVIEHETGSFNTKQALIHSVTVLGVGFLTGLIVGGILPALEGLFRITTKMSWLELSDLNHKLLRKMQLEAPGTFHHSMVVATLAEAAAESIGANAPMCRVASYFHDIGKVEKPEYFIENQGDTNPHDNLTPNMSALVIIAHVKDGIDLAVRHKLNREIINVIKEHHGNTLVYYFYRKAHENRDLALQEVKEGIRNEEDVPEVFEKGFRYPGPRPRTKESGIIALADSIESASRSIKKVTIAKLQSMIADIVNNKIKDGQLDECPLTFQELQTIKETFATTLKSMLHNRIDYPKEDTDRKSDRKTRKPPITEATSSGS